MSLRLTPEIRFIYDESHERGERVHASPPLILLMFAELHRSLGHGLFSNFMSHPHSDACPALRLSTQLVHNPLARRPACSACTDFASLAAAGAEAAEADTAAGGGRDGAAAHHGAAVSAGGRG